MLNYKCSQCGSNIPLIKDFNCSVHNAYIESMDEIFDTLVASLNVYCPHCNSIRRCYIRYSFNKEYSLLPCSDLLAILFDKNVTITN